MGRILFVLALSVITIQCTVVQNEEVAYSRLARSPCEDCNDWPPPPSGPPRPRYLHPYPRYLDYPPPPPPPPPPPFYYPHSAPPPPPPPPFFRHHWHKVINDSDENDDDDGDYNDSASAVSGITGQNTGQAFSMASAGINGGSSSKYSPYGVHYSTGSQSPNKNGQSSESIESQASGSGSRDQSNPNTYAGNNPSTDIGASLAAESGAKSSSQISTGSNSVTGQGGAQSTASSNAQLSSQTGFQSSAVSNAQSSLHHNIQLSSDSQAQVTDQTYLSSTTTPEFGSPNNRSSSHSLDIKSSGLNKQSSPNFVRPSPKGSEIKSNLYGDHLSGGSNLQPTSVSGSSAVSNSLYTSGIASSEGSQNHFEKIDGSNAKSSSFGSSSSAQSHAQSVIRQGSKASSFSAQSNGLDDQSFIGFNVQSSKDLGGLSTESQLNSFAHLNSSGFNTADSNNDVSGGQQFPSGFQLTTANPNAQSSSSTHTSGKLNNQPSNSSGRSSFETVNKQSSDNGFENQSPIDFKPLHSDNFNDSPSLSSSSTGVNPQPSVGLNNQAPIHFGGSALERSISQFNRQKPLGDFNSQSSSTFDSFLSGSNVQSSSKSSASYNKHSSNNYPSSNSHTYHNNYGGQSYEINLQSFANSGSSEESKPQPIDNGPIQPTSNNDKSFGVAIQPDINSHKPSSSLDGQPFNGLSDTFGSANTQLPSNGFGDQTLGFDTLKSNSFGRSSSDKFAFQPSGTGQSGGFPANSSGGFNNLTFESSSEVSTKGSNLQSQSSSFSHHFLTSSHKQSARNGGDSFSRSNTNFRLGDQDGGVNSQSTDDLGGSSAEAGNAQFDSLKHRSHRGYLDQSSENLSDLSSKGFGQFSTESIIQSPKNDLYFVNPKIQSNDHSYKTFASSESQSPNSFDRSHVRTSNGQIHIPLSGPTSIGNSDHSGQGRRDFTSYEIHKGGNTGSIENGQQSFSSENFKTDSVKCGPSLDISGLTASGLRKSFANLKHFEPNYTASRYDSSLEKPTTDSSEQSSASLNNQFSEQKEQRPSNFGRIALTKSEAQISNNMGSFSHAPSDSTINSNDQSSFGTPSSAGNIKPNSFGIHSSSTNTQTSSSFGDWASQDSNIHSFAIGDQVCICGSQKSALFTAISQSGVPNEFGSHSSAESKGLLSNSLGRGTGDQSANKQIKNGNGNVAGYDVQFGKPNIGISNEKGQIDSSTFSEVNSASNHRPSSLPNPYTSPSRLILPPLGPTLNSSPPAISPEVNSNPSTVSGNTGNNDRNKEDYEYQHNEYHEDGNTGPFTDQQQTSDFGGFRPGFGGGSSTSESGFTSSGTKGGNEFGIPDSRIDGHSFGSGSGSSGSFTDSNSRGDGFGSQGSTNEQGYPNGYASGNFGTQSLSLPYPRPQEPKSSESGGSSYALSNARSKNRDAFAVSVGL